jgi:aryl carrier-like protein
MEVILCSAVADVLGLSEADISAEDSFFRRRGDSVAAMMLVGSLREQRCHLTVADIFEHPQLNILATKMHRALPSTVVKAPLPFSLLGDDTSSHQAVIEQAMKKCTAAQDETEDIYPCSPLQHAFFLFSSTRENCTLIARFAYSLRPEINLDRLQKAWSETTKAHPMFANANHPS